MEKSFAGFPPRPEVTPLPNVFFSDVLTLVDNILELKAVMQVFFLLSRRKGYPRFVTLNELLENPVMARNMRGLQGDHEVILRQALDAAVLKGILLHVAVHRNGIPDEAYFINNQSERATIDRILDGSLKMPEAGIRKAEPAVADLPSDIYNLYEQNIGMLTPILAEELQEAEHRYPADWIQDAFREAVRANVRSWKYIHSILKRWEREGRKDGKPVGDTRKERDPDKYIRGKYGHMVQR
jgi:DnaD/phage-associated family protein